jgi:HEAT repeat protein
MKETVQDSADPVLWQRLLGCLALHHWGEHLDSHRRADREASARIDAAITALFVEDADGAASQAAKLQALRAGLVDAEYRIRQVAAIVLALRGDAEGIATVIEAVRTGDPGPKMQAVGALGKLKDERGGWALVEALASDDETLHRGASRALGELGGYALPALLEALKSPKPHVRWHAVWALGKIDELPAAAGLAEALADSDYSVRWAAGDALAGMGALAARAILERLTRYVAMDETYQIAYHALHRIGPRETQARLQPALQALRGPAAAVEAPRAASRLFQTWESETQT